MAEGDLIGAACDQFVKLVGPTIKRQFNYLCCFTSNINNLEKEAKELDDAAEGIQVQVDRALNDVRIIVPQVKTWLEKSEDIKDQKTAILDQVPNVGSFCFKLRARFSLSKRATKTADRMKELRGECSKFGDVSLAGPPVASKTVQLGNTYEFESRKQTEGEIMEVLKGGDVNMIGISGMGGLGKTTMSKRIMNRVLEEHVFEEAVFAVISQPVDKLKIQLDIGGQLGLKLQDEHSETVRIQKLHERLSGAERILLVLDDVWQGIELEEFGIPHDSKGCTILITSRNRDALRATGVQKEFGMKILSKEEAWFLFKEKVGTCMDDIELKSIAGGVVKECEGLPIALATVGATLKDEKNPSVWRDALSQLRQCVPDIPHFIEKVYNPLKLSYDFLSSKHAKFLFLLCSLYPEDEDIAIEELTCFGMGLGIFEGIKNMEEVRDRVFVSISLLKSRSLLLDSEKRNHVTMHDIVRDVCIYIVKQEGYVGGNDCFWISSFELFGERSNLTIGLGSPHLRLLFLMGNHNYRSKEKEFKFDHTFFEGISDLYVLCIKRYSSLTSLPLTHSLKNLKSLVLHSCDKVKTISFVGEFVNLEILICRNSHLIEELPLEIKRLNRLKLLELTGCYNLQRIGQGIISSLLRLEELKMLNSFKSWESEDREERENVGLRELEALTNLRCLEIEVADSALATKKMHLSSKINRFHISLGTDATLPSNDHSYKKMLFLKLKREEPCLGNSMEMQLLRDTEYLYLSGNGANRVDLVKCQNIRLLKLEWCENVKNIITSMVDNATSSIEHLILGHLPKFEGICDGSISSNYFYNLKELKLSYLWALKQLWKSVPPLFTNLSSINIDECHHMCNLGQLSITEKDCFPQLENLIIRKCNMMEQVFSWNKDGESNNHHCVTKVFPKLKEVELHHLRNLATFYLGTGGFEFPLLTKLSIWKCPKWKSMGSNRNTGGNSEDIDDFLHLFCQPKKVSFGNLKELELHYQRNPFCGHKIPLSLLNGLEELSFSSLYGSRSLFSSSVALNLINLKVLKIEDCDEMLKVIEDTEEQEKEKVVSGTAEMPLILFPKLEELKLKDLPKLVNFYEWKWDIMLPLLRIVTIKSCPDIKNLSLRFIVAPNLEAFTTYSKNNIEIGANVSFDSPETLEISQSEKPLYGHKLFIPFFNGLKELHVSNCYGSMSCLFTASIATHLQSLQVLAIEYCYEMVKVIEDDEEKKVGSGGKRTLLFPQLKILKLVGLSKLVSFCEWKCDIELPSMRDVLIEKCPVLRTFTMGSIAAAQNLESVKINYEYIGGGTKDLNSVLQRYMAPIEKLREEMKGEIEEEDQN